MADLVKELEKKAAVTRVKADGKAAVWEAQKLLMEDSSADFQLLRNMGLHTSIVQAQNLVGRRIELERLDKQYGKVFTIEEIKSLSMKYALKFLRSDSYKGIIDVEITAKMKQFSKDCSVPLDSTTLGFKFFIMAPQKAFNLVSGEKKPVPVDPILFYQIDENHYRMIHKWGNDFSVTRAILGWKYRSELNYMLFWTFMIAFIPAISLSSIFHHIWIAGAITAFSFAVVAIFHLNNTHVFKNWDKLWNSKEKQEYN